MSVSTKKTAQNLWHLIFQWRGSIWAAVLPYCVLNCLIMVLVEALAMMDVKIAFSPSGHGLMTLIVSFLVINKVNLAYDRYMQSRHSVGHALSACRELNQLSYLLTEGLMHHSPEWKKGTTEWRRQTATRIIDLMDCTIRVVKDPHQANYLARNVDIEHKTDDDPMQHVQALRTHMYNVNRQVEKDATTSNSGDDNNNNQNNNPILELFERMKLMDMLTEFVVHYRNLLKCASTPLPFPLVQMGRTFLFLWTFTIPLVLRGVVEELYSALAFVFFLTYGFVGLELVCMKLMNPFGDGTNDLNVSGMKEATIIGMEKDMQTFSGSSNYSLLDKRTEFSRQKPRPPMKNRPPDGYSQNVTTNAGHREATDTCDDPNSYHQMADHHTAIFPSHS